MTAAEDRATAVQLLRAAAADHLTHLEPAERDELVERITGALDRCARHRAAVELRKAAEEQESESERSSWTKGSHGGGHQCAAGFLHDRADALEAE